MIFVAKLTKPYILIIPSIFECNQYLGPAVWGLTGCDAHAVCATGVNQSPINLPNTRNIENDGNAWMMEKLLTYPSIEYSAAYFTKTISGDLFNNGHSGIVIRIKS